MLPNFTKAITVNALWLNSAFSRRGLIFSITIKKSLSKSRSLDFCPCYLLRVWSVYFTLKSVIHAELSFVTFVRCPHPLWPSTRILLSPPRLFLPPLWISSCSVSFVERDDHVSMALILASFAKISRLFSRESISRLTTMLNRSIYLFPLPILQDYINWDLVELILTIDFIHCWIWFPNF